MAHRRIEMGLILVLVTMLWAEARAQQSCTNVLVSMSSCLNYVQGNSSTPSSQCCTQLANVVRSSPQCLCQVLNGGASSLGIYINQTQALALPSACNVQTQPISSCNAASPADTPAGAPEASGTIPGTGSNTTSSTGDTSSGGTSVKLPFSLLVFLLFAASYDFIFSTY